MLCSRILKLSLLVTYLTAQPGNWTELPNAPVVTRFNDIQFLDENQGWAVNGWGQIYYTPDGGNTWDLQFEQSQTHFRSVGFFDELNGWAGNVGYGEFGATDTMNLYETSDGGVSWVPFDNFTGPEPTGICGLQVINDTVMCAVGRVRGPAFFAKTTNKGETWISYNFDQYVSVAGLIDLHFFNPDTGLIVGLTNVDHTQSRGIVLKTTDGGESWLPMIITSRMGEWAWKINFPSDSVGYVSLQRNYESPIFFIKTIDGGQTWEEKLFMESYYFIQGVGFINDTLGWMGGNSTLPTFVTVDGGESWSAAGFGSRVNRLDFVNQNLGYACGRTIYKYSNTLDIKHEMESVSILPKNPVINYPNPFNPSTTIMAYIPESGLLQISIIDLLGRNIRTLFNDMIYEGESWKKINWDGLDDNKKRVSGGVYFCHIKNGNAAINHKMILLK